MELLKLKIVMLVDDDPVSNFLTKGILEEMITSEMEISVAEDGSEALELVKECITKNISIVYILLDLNMPVMNGIEFLRELAEVKNKPVYINIF